MGNGCGMNENFPKRACVASTLEGIAKSQNIDAYTLGVSACIRGYPLMRMERVMLGQPPVEVRP